MLRIARRYRLRRLDFLVVGLNLIGVSATTGLTLAQFPALTRPLVAAGAVAIIVTVGASVVSLEIENEAQDAKERATRQELARSLVEDLCRTTVRAMSRCPEQTGVIVFLPDQSGTLQSTYTLHKEGKPDRDLRFAKYEGATGHAWATGEQFCAKPDGR
jgi:glucose uptake protein GlcU